jgi:hypothetical protein
MMDRPWTEKLMTANEEEVRARFDELWDNLNEWVPRDVLAHLLGNRDAAWHLFQLGWAAGFKDGMTTAEAIIKRASKS